MPTIPPLVLSPGAVTTAILLTITLLTTSIVTIINTYFSALDRRDRSRRDMLLLERANATLAQGQDNGHKADNLLRATDKIHELTNSTNSELQKALELSKAQTARVEQQNASLERLILELKQSAHDLAQHQATSDLRVAQALTVPSPEQVHALAAAQRNRRVGDNPNAPPAPVVSDSGTPIVEAPVIVVAPPKDHS